MLDEVLLADTSQVNDTILARVAWVCLRKYFDIMLPGWETKNCTLSEFRFTSSTNILRNNYDNNFNYYL